jgi:NAD(P)-dependent dehydrogenase (short-subunit alcohol dehydrogenase family)
MSLRLAAKVALITGAGGGIGSVTAELFAREGAHVIVTDKDERRALAATERITNAGGSAISLVLDVTDGERVESAFRSVDERFGRLDVLVNNAFAFFNDVTLSDLDRADWDRTIAVCLTGPFLCAQQAVRRMRTQRSGSIIWLSSVNALWGVGGTAYTAAKGGLISLARLVAAEYGEFNIRSNVVCPGTIQTEACMAHWRKFPDGFEKLRAMYPLGRIGEPLEVAQYLLFLASDESSFVTGSVQVVDGGLLAGRKFETTESRPQESSL